MNLGPYVKDPLADNIYISFAIPAMCTLLFMFYPTGETATITVGALYLGLMSIILVISKVKELHYYLKWRFGMLISYMDISMLFIIALFARLYNSLPLLFLMIGLAVATAIVGHRWGVQIFNELEMPQTRIGRKLVSIGIGFAGISGGIGYAFVLIYGVGTAVVVLYFLMLLITLFVHSAFVHRMKYPERL